MVSEIVTKKLDDLQAQIEQLRKLLDDVMNTLVDVEKRVEKLEDE